MSVFLLLISIHIPMLLQFLQIYLKFKTAIFSMGLVLLLKIMIGIYFVSLILMEFRCIWVLLPSKFWLLQNEKKMNCALLVHIVLD